MAGGTPRMPVLVIAGDPWREAELGSVVRWRGGWPRRTGRTWRPWCRRARTPPCSSRPAGCWMRRRWCGPGSGPQSHRPDPRRRRSSPRWSSATTGGSPAGVVESFQVAGLTHLLAVSGTNLTLVVGFVLVLARWAGVRARGLVVVGALGIARLRAARTARAERGARGDGVRGAGRHGHERPGPERPCPGRGGLVLLLLDPSLLALARFRALGAGHRGHPRAGPAVAGR